MITTKPLIFFDLETTGTSIQDDRIVQIATIKINLDGTRENKVHLIDPGIPIPKGASDVHGITDAMVQGKPKFKEVAKSMHQYFHGSDIAGYNSDNFDVPLLIAEFNRCDIEFPDWDLNFLDILKIERKVNSHTLFDTYKRYTGEDLSDAHDAMVDTKATEVVLIHQMENMASIIQDVKGINTTKEITPEFLDKWCQGETERFDYAGKMYLKEGVVYWNFSKLKDQPVLDDRGFLNWFLSKPFPLQSKKLLRELLTQNQ